MGLRWCDGQEWTGRRAISSPGEELPPLGAHREVVARGLAVLALVLLVVTGLVWWAWQWRMAVSSPDRLRRAPGAHVAAWLVPVANLWLPIQNMHDLWHAYEPHDPRGRGRGISLVLAWWTAWIVTAALGVLGLRTLVHGGSPDSSLGVAWALAAVLARAVVRRPSWRALLYHAGLD